MCGVQTDMGGEDALTGLDDIIPRKLREAGYTMDTLGKLSEAELLAVMQGLGMDPDNPYDADEVPEEEEEEEEGEGGVAQGGKGGSKMDWNEFADQLDGNEVLLPKKLLQAGFTLDQLIDMDETQLMELMEKHGVDPDDPYSSADDEALEAFNKDKASGEYMSSGSDSEADMEAVIQSNRSRGRVRGRGSMAHYRNSELGGSEDGSDTDECVCLAVPAPLSPARLVSGV